MQTCFASNDPGPIQPNPPLIVTAAKARPPLPVTMTTDQLQPGNTHSLNSVPDLLLGLLCRSQTFDGSACCPP